MSTPQTPLPYASVLLGRGIVSLVFGLAMVFWPRQELTPALSALPLDIVDWLLMAYLALTGILLFLQSRGLGGTARLIVLGQAIVVLPALLFLAIADQPGQLVAAVSVWALLHGGLEVYLWRVLRTEYRGASDMAISGAAHLVVAAALFANATMQPLSVLGFTGAAALIAGAFFVLGAIGAKRAARQTDDAASDPAGDVDGHETEPEDEASPVEQDTATHGGSAPTSEEPGASAEREDSTTPRD